MEDSRTVWYIGASEDHLATCSIDQMIEHGNGDMLIKLSGINSPEEVKSRSRWGIYVFREQINSVDLLGHDIFMVEELLGMDVLDVSTGTRIGHIVSYYERPGQDLIGIEFRGEEVLCPLVDPLVPIVDRIRREVFVQWSILEPSS